MSYPISRFTDLGIDDPVDLSKWNIGIEKCLKYSIENDIPCFINWRGYGCAVCSAIDMGFLSTRFNELRNASNIKNIVWCVSGNKNKNIDELPDWYGKVIGNSVINSVGFTWIRSGSTRINNKGAGNYYTSDLAKMMLPDISQSWSWNDWSLVYFPYIALYWRSHKIDLHYEGSSHFKKVGNTSELNGELAFNFIQEVFKDYVPVKKFKVTFQDWNGKVLK